MPPGSQLEPVPSLHRTVTADPRWLRAARGGCTHLDQEANNQGSLCSPCVPATAPSPTGCRCDGRGLARLRGCVWLWAGPGCRAPFALCSLEAGEGWETPREWRGLTFLLFLGVFSLAEWKAPPKHTRDGEANTSAVRIGRAHV